jgi:hypothetical protein
MPDQKEPESYGSKRETSGPDQGCLSQPEWTDQVDVLRPAGGEALLDDTTRKVTARFAGARREGFFRTRDWE